VRERRRRGLLPWRGRGPRADICQMTVAMLNAMDSDPEWCRRVSVVQKAHRFLPKAGSSSDVPASIIHEEDRLGKEVFAIKSSPGLWVLCVCKSTEYIRSSLVFASSDAGIRSLSNPLGRPFLARQTMKKPGRTCPSSSARSKAVPFPVWLVSADVCAVVDASGHAYHQADPPSRSDSLDV
jgi:hypothetical protein